MCSSKICLTTLEMFFWKQFFWKEEKSYLDWVKAVKMDQRDKAKIDH